MAEKNLLYEVIKAFANVDLSPERYKALALKAGDVVFVSPKAAKIFEPEYAI